MWRQLYLRCEYTWQRAGSWARNNCSLHCILESTGSPRVVGGVLEAVPGAEELSGALKRSWLTSHLDQLAYLPVSALDLTRNIRPGEGARTNRTDRFST